MLVVVFLDHPPQDVIDSIAAHGGEILTEAQTLPSSPHSIYQRVTISLRSPLKLEAGSFLRLLRRLRDLSGAEVAARLNRSRQTISNWEDGRLPHRGRGVRERFLEIVSAYRCYQEEADQLFRLIGEPVINDEEWRCYGKLPDAKDNIPIIGSMIFPSLQ